VIPVRDQEASVPFSLQQQQFRHCELSMPAAFALVMLQNMMHVIVCSQQPGGLLIANVSKGQPYILERSPGDELMDQVSEVVLIW
jgi:hypothetical protein